MVSSFHRRSREIHKLWHDRDRNTPFAAWPLRRRKARAAGAGLAKVEAGSRKNTTGKIPRLRANASTPC